MLRLVKTWGPVFVVSPFVVALAPIFGVFACVAFASGGFNGDVDDPRPTVRH